jgi:Domain of unknown function (DUF4136)
MKATRLTRAAALAAALLVVGCESGPNVRSDFDKSADFGKYHTFNFVAKPSTDKSGYSSLLTQQLEAAVSEEMRKRGYTQSDHPDLLINFSGKLQKMQDVRSDPGTPVSPYYGYRAGMYGAWPGYAGDVYTVHYTEGTLNIDLVDAAKDRMVWEGVGVGEVTQENLQNREAAINKAVSDIFARYPFRAGQAQPIATASK